MSEMQDTIRSVFKDSETCSRVEELLSRAQAESERKVIVTPARPGMARRLFIRSSIILRYGVHWPKLLYIVKMIRNLLLGRLYRLTGSNRHILRGCEFDITFKCNFNCMHCTVARLSDDMHGQELSVDEYRKLVKEAMKLGAVSFGLEGGEPFMRKDWDKIIEACLPRLNHIIITTNGYLFDEKTARRCSDLGVDTINISIDSGIPELHDLFRRKKGSFEYAMNTIRLCRKHGLKVIINTVVHKQNLYTEGFRKILELGEREKILVHLLFAKGSGNFKDSEFLLDEADIETIDEIIKVHYPHAFIHHDTNLNCTRSGCNGTKEMLQFTPYGDAMHCAHMHVLLGNIRNQSLRDIRERALRNTPFNRYQPCFLSMDREFMSFYYNLLQDRACITINEFEKAYRDAKDQGAIR